MSSVTTVRRLSPADWELYRRVRLAALAEAPAAFQATHAEELAFSDVRWRERLTRRNTLLAEDGEGPSGLVGVIARDAAPGTGKLVSMWVAPRARGTGVADRLVTGALGLAGELGFTAVVLSVVDGNGAAERLYARHGFQRTGATGTCRNGRGTEFEMAVRVV
ncbi:GNAT family N-acetyltransferase [Streptomyces boncukensis]|uniref:GNAT family N-acetyltransferase n=1 Tax=Streptomyces boncukensis TaxID=2711219 RepID=A0A6G4X130_9ACTN|nr:GNAT family N-acetyltransferase [Streptomyces boncukensis]NGO70454.1 GNAT family N-acetyltransferase [Streptomyces boncukensis]